MLAFPHEHWQRLIHSVGLVAANAILDVGCGPGAWLPALARVNRRVVGVDIDDEALEIARRLCSQHSNVEVLRMPAESLEFEDGSFDVVACFGTLPYIGQPAAVGEMARVLEPGGRLVLGTPGSGYYARHITEGAAQDDRDAIRYGLDPMLVALGRNLGGRRIAAGSLRSWSPRAVRRLLERHGFAVDRVIRDVTPVDPSWPESFLGRPLYFIVFATKSHASMHRPSA
jgi:SAM-dependent methyltransferase